MRASRKVEVSYEFVKTSAPEPRDLIRRMKEYHPPLGDRSGLRLDFNENTVACSPRVLEILGQISRSHLTMYPERDRVELRRGAPRSQARAGPAHQRRRRSNPCHLPDLPRRRGRNTPPGSDLFHVRRLCLGNRRAACRSAGRYRFRFPLERLLQNQPGDQDIAIANPNSPTGQAVSRDAILKIVDAAPHAMILIDEAYFHFYGETVLDLIDRAPNVIVARTFSKAYGLAGLRLGLLATGADSMHWLRRVISPYSVNSIALACLPAALADKAYIEAYVNEVLLARAEFTAALEDVGVRYWPSEANFVLA